MMERLTVAASDGGTSTKSMTATSECTGAGCHTTTNSTKLRHNTRNSDSISITMIGVAIFAESDSHTTCLSWIGYVLELCDCHLTHP